jgi:hypothetical protein
MKPVWWIGCLRALWMETDSPQGNAKYLRSHECAILITNAKDLPAETLMVLQSNPGRALSVRTHQPARTANV